MWRVLRVGDGPGTGEWKRCVGGVVFVCVFVSFKGFREAVGFLL